MEDDIEDVMEDDMEDDMEEDMEGFKGCVNFLQWRVNRD